MNIKKGDTVKMLGGKDRGKTGTVIKVYPEEGRVMIEGLNVFKKRIRPKQQRQKGEVVNVARPVPVSRVMLVCKNCKEPSRVGFRMEGNVKVRFCRRCGVNT